MSQERPTPRFAIFYEDEVVEGGGPGDETVDIVFRVSKKWIEAPVDGVQAVVVEDPHTSRKVLNGEDYYYAIPSGHIGATSDLGAFLRGHLQGLVKFGLMVPAEKWIAALQRIKAYVRIPKVGPREPNPTEGLE